MCGRHDEFQDTELQDVNRVLLTEGRDQGRIPLKTVMTFWGQQKL
jgi:hypothetical protein